jgi:hypothetical protein
MNNPDTTRTVYDAMDRFVSRDVDQSVSRTLDLQGVMDNVYWEVNEDTYFAVNMAVETCYFQIVETVKVKNWFVPIPTHWNTWAET